MYCNNFRSKRLPCTSTDSTGRIPFSLSLSYSFKAYMCLSMFLSNILCYARTLRKFDRTGKFSPFVSTTRITWMILIRSDIHAKLFCSITLISNFLLRKTNYNPNIKQLSFSFNDYNATNGFTK